MTLDMWIAELQRLRQEQDCGHLQVELGGSARDSKARAEVQTDARWPNGVVVLYDGETP